MQPQQHDLSCSPPKGLKWRSLGFHNLHYYEWGNPDSDKVAVCVHGLTRNARDFDFLACALAEKGYRVICPDVIGRGKSQWLNNPKWYGYPLYVTNMMTLLTKLELKDVHWVGTSMGGLIGMMVETHGPHLIRKMVLNDIGPYIPKQSLMRIGSYVGQNMTFSNREAAFKHFKEIHDTFGITKDEHWQHLFEHSFVEENDGAYKSHYDPGLALAFRSKRGKQIKMPNMDMWKMWDLINVPMLVLRGEKSDLLLKDTAERMVQKECASLVEFPEIGHAPMLMEDDQVKIVVNWLEK